MKTSVGNGWVALAALASALPIADGHAAEPPAAPAHDAVEQDSGIGPSTRPMWLALGFGPNVGIGSCVRHLCNLEQSYTQFKISEDFGYHVGGGGDGFAIGANLQQAFGNDVYRVSGGFRMWWDVAVSDDLGFYVTPMLHLGYSLQHFDFGPLGTLTEHFFNPQLGLDLRLALADRAIVYVRPLTADMSVGKDGVGVAYDAVVGGGFTFVP